MTRQSMQQQQQQQQQTHEPQPGIDEQLSPPLPPTSTHPLHKPGQPKLVSSAAANAQFNYSNAEPPKVAFYPTGGVVQAGASGAPGKGTPWEREEREKEQEMRRDQMRLWRDQQIAELSSVQRTGQQEEQLKTLILERDFERRAQMDEEEDEQADGHSHGHHATTNGELKETQQGGSSSENQMSSQPPIQPKSILKHNTGSAAGGAGGVAQLLLNDASGSSGSMGSPSHSNQASPMKQPPKTASFSDQVMTHRHLTFDGTDQVNNNQVLSQLTKEMTHLAMAPDGTMDLQHQMYLQQHQQQNPDLYPEYPPPPPERNSSYVFMSQQQQKLRTHQQQKQMIENNNNNTMMSNGGVGATMTTTNGQQQQQHQSYMNGGPISPTAGPGYANGSNNMNNNNGNFMIPPPANFNTSLVRGDNKRVSFHHEEDNNNGTATTMTMTVQQQSVTGGVDYTSGGSDKMMIREDPDVSAGGMRWLVTQRNDGNLILLFGCGLFIYLLQKFIDETTAMLDAPQTPDAADKVNWNMTVTQTPGVIGAQEVYR